ncbi:MAG TPA: sugar ABC transporter substrate-binding protein [Candidatus Acidoferrum sp.]|nr:sugar ABC transporter substrate-binding protein [Candidatus Acidoferrum sp.]
MAANALVAVCTKFYALPLWMFWLVLGTSFGALGMWVLVARKKHLRIFVAMAAFHRKQFFADFLLHLLSELAKRDIDAVVKLPERDYDPTAQGLHFEEIIDQMHDFAGGIVVPVEAHLRRKEILGFASRVGKPVVFVDAQPFQNEADYPPNTCFVGFDNSLGGQCAAEAVVKLLRDKGVTVPNVLVIGSNVQTERQQSFIQDLKRTFPSAKIELNEDGRFMREDAQQIARSFLEDSRHSGLHYDAIFCTNDEMALGTADAIQMLPHDCPDQFNIVGYDGIPEVQRMIDKGNTPLKNTIVQSPAELAAHAVQALVEMIEKGESGSRIKLLRPKIFRNFRRNEKDSDSAPRPKKAFSKGGLTEGRSEQEETETLERKGA